MAFERDGLRDGEHLRDEMTGWFATALRDQPARSAVVEGTPEERVAQALAHLRAAVAMTPLFATWG